MRVPETTLFPARRIDQHQAGVDRAQERLASGKRINSAADDAAGLSIAQRLAALEAALDQGSRNLHDGYSLAAVAEGSLGETSDMLGRMRELSVQAQNGTLSDGDRAAIQGEYDQLAAEVTRISESTSFNGRNLLNGDLSGGITFEGGQGPNTSLTLGDHSASALGISGRSVADPGTLDALDGAIGSVSSSRASLGSFQNRVTHQIDEVQATRRSLAEAESRIADADFAAETSSLTRNQIMSQADVALRAHANVSAHSVLKFF